MTLTSGENAPRADCDDHTAWGAGRHAAIQFLVSVRSRSEASRIAGLRFDVLDFKEPNRGALGPCDPSIWQECRREVAHRGRWSVALGEGISGAEMASEVPAAFDFVKVGLVAQNSPGEVLRLWERTRRRLADAVQLVAVAYADFADHGGLSPEQIFKAALQFGLRTVLIDTYHKGPTHKGPAHKGPAHKGPAHGGPATSLGHLGAERIGNLIRSASDQDCSVVLAGGIGIEELPLAIALGAHRVGVRGAVCRGGRDGELDAAAVSHWIERLEELNTRGKSD